MPIWTGLEAVPERNEPLPHEFDLPPSSYAVSVFPSPINDAVPWAVLNERGIALFHAGRYQEALVLLMQGRDMKPDEPVLRKNVAQVHAQLGWEAVRSEAFHDAETHFNQAIQTLDREASYYVGNALALHRQGKEEEALRRLELALQLDPDHLIGNKILGEVYYMRHELEKAAAAWENAIRLDPGDMRLAARVEKLRRENQLFSRFTREGTRHFDLLFEGHSGGDPSRQVLDLLEDAYQKIGRAFSYYPEKPIVAVLYTDQQFRDVTRSPAWTKALFDGKIHLPVGGSTQDEPLLEKVIYHEFTHALIYQLSQGKIPAWLNEGLALHFEKNGVEEGTMPMEEALLMSQSSRMAGLIPLEALHGSFLDYDEATAQKVYAQSRSATAYLIERYGLLRIKSLLEKVSIGSNFSSVFEDVFLISYADFQKEWQKRSSEE